MLGTVLYGHPVDRATSIVLLRAAVERGVASFDTAEACGPFANEELVGEGSGFCRSQVVVAIKFGFDIAPATSRGGDDVNSRSEGGPANARCTRGLFNRCAGAVPPTASRQSGRRRTRFSSARSSDHQR